MLLLESLCRKKEKVDYILGQLKPISDAVGLIFFAFFGGIIRTVYRPRARNVTAYALSIFISVPIGVLAGNVAIEFGLSDNTAKGFAVVAGILAHDIIESIFWASDRVKLERETIFKIIWQRFFGKND
jgi:hypothetical protein